MSSNSIPHYLYKRNHTWCVQKAFRISGQCNRVQAEPANSKFQRARLLALRLQTLCQQMVTSLGAQKTEEWHDGKISTRAKLRAKIAMDRRGKQNIGSAALPVMKTI